MHYAIALYLVAGLAVTLWIGWTACVNETLEDLLHPDFCKPAVLPLTGLAFWLCWLPVCLMVGITSLWYVAASPDLHEQEPCGCEVCGDEEARYASLIDGWEQRPVPQELTERVRREIRDRELVG